MPFRYDKVNDRMEFPMKLYVKKFADIGRPISKELREAMGSSSSGEDERSGDDKEDEYEDSARIRRTCG